MGNCTCSKINLNTVGEFIYARANETCTLGREKRGMGQALARPHVGSVTRH